MRKSSKAVSVALVGASAAAFLAACGDEPAERQTVYCVDDRSEQVVENRFCEDNSHATYYPGVDSPYWWYYGGYSDDADIHRGSRLKGGRHIHPANRKAIRSLGGIARGRSGAVGRSTARPTSSFGGAKGGGSSSAGGFGGGGKSGGGGG